MIEGVKVTRLSIIETDGGDVLHGMRHTDKGYFGFGEAYFSMVNTGSIKGWKRHHEMVLNLVVPFGSIRFILYDDRQGSASINQFQQVTLSRGDNYCRLTVPPMVWAGFQGLGKEASILLNIASIEHSPEEVDKKKLADIKFDWEKNR